MALTDYIKLLKRSLIKMSDFHFIGSNYDSAIADVNNHLFTNIYNDCAGDEDKTDGYDLDWANDKISSLDDWCYRIVLHSYPETIVKVSNQDNVVRLFEEYDTYDIVSVERLKPKKYLAEKINELKSK